MDLIKLGTLLWLAGMIGLQLYGLYCSVLLGFGLHWPNLVAFVIIIIISIVSLNIMLMKMHQI